MAISVTFRNIEPDEKLKTYAEDKISKITKYTDLPFNAHIVLSVRKFRNQADVSINLNGAAIKGSEETDDMYSAMDQVMDKIERQVKRHIAKSKNYRSLKQRNSKRAKYKDLDPMACLSGLCN
jgi:putative sigma-54 modulation protein